METLFLSHRFRTEDEKLVSWIRDLIVSHDLTPITGEVLEGQELSTAVREKIDRCDALVALMSPDEPKKAKGRFRTTDWVRDELNHARSMKKPAIALVARTVDVDGIERACEHIKYDPRLFIPALLKLSHTINGWKRTVGSNARVRLFSDTLSPIIRKAPTNVRCEYRLMRASDGEAITSWQPARLEVRAEGEFAVLPGLRPESELEVRLEHNGKVWQSPTSPQFLHVRVDERGAT